MANRLTSKTVANQQESCAFAKAYIITMAL